MTRMIGALSVSVAGTLMAAAALAGIPDASLAGRPFELRADSVEYEAAREVYVARGNVRIVSRETELRADWMAFNETQGRGIATGNVVYRSGGDELLADFVQFNVDSGRGVLIDGRFESGENQFRMEGGEVVRHGDDTYSFKNGMFTTCRCPAGERDPWQIRAKSADLEVGGYGTARNTTFDILGVPVVWLPWMIYPLKTERQSGLLFPEFAYGHRNGFDIGLPIFWAARDEVNVTLTPHWLSKRGAKGDLDVEYVFGEKSQGEVSGAFIYDQDIDPNSAEEPFDRERWSVYGEKDFYLPYAWRFKSDFQFVSDNAYLVDFDDLPQRRSDRFLESNAFVGRSFGADGRFGALGSAVYADDLQNPDDQDRDEFLLQRLPALELVALPAALSESIPLLSHIVPAFDAEYTHFRARQRPEREFDQLPEDYFDADHIFVDTGIDAVPSVEEFGFGEIVDGIPNLDPHGDDFSLGGGPELDGTFEEGEPLADEGHRVDLSPRLGLPFRIGDAVEAYPEVGWHQTLYDTHFQGFEERHLLTAQLDLRTRLIRSFGEGVTHILEPRLGYALVTDLGQHQADKPLFVPRTAVPQRRIRQLDLDNVTRDWADRVRDYNGVTFGFENRIFGRAGGGGSQLVADFHLSGEYRIEDGEFGDILVGGRAYPFDGARLWADLGFDPERGKISEAILQFAYASRAGHAASLGYRYLRDTPRFFEDFDQSEDRFDDFTEDFKRINQLRFEGRLAITARWAAHYAMAYSFEDTLLLQNHGGIEYVSKCRCWSAGIDVGHDRRRGFQLAFVYRLLGMGKEPGPGAPQRFGAKPSDFLDGL